MRALAGWSASRCARFYLTAALQAAGGAALLPQGTRARAAALLCAVSVGVEVIVVGTIGVYAVVPGVGGTSMA